MCMYPCVCSTAGELDGDRDIIVYYHLVFLFPEIFHDMYEYKDIRTAPIPLNDYIDSYIPN